MTVVNKDFVVNNGLQITGYITSVGGSTPSNGQLLIGDATNGRFSVGSLTGSNGISFTQGAGTINITTNATSANTASTIVARDGSGNFTAGTISANISGGTISGTTGSFTGITTFTGAVNSTNNASLASLGVNGGGSLLLVNGSGAADTKKWDIYTTSSSLSFRTIDDAWTTGIAWLTANRSGNAVTGINTVIRPTFNGNLAWDAGNLNISLYAPLASPVLTGTPTAPTAALGTNTTQLATTAFVLNEFASPPAIGSTTANTGAFTTLTTSGALTANSLSTSSATISGGSINNTPIGATTASTGKFTTLTTTGTTTFGGRTFGSGSTYTAAGTTQATGTAITTDFCFVNAGAASAGVVLPPVAMGATCFVVNYSGNSIMVYPPSGAYLDFGAQNAGMTMANQNKLLFCSDGGSWFSMNATYA